MASDLISGKALLEAMDEVERKLEMCMCIPSWATALKCIRDFPTVDAVEVVRCKDCTMYKEFEWCDFFKEPMRADGYCSLGAKKGRGGTCNDKEN